MYLDSKMSYTTPKCESVSHDYYLMNINKAQIMLKSNAYSNKKDKKL